MRKARVRYFQDRKGEWRWTLRAPNGEPIADSAEGYVQRRDCVAGFNLVRQYGPDADFEIAEPAGISPALGSLYGFAVGINEPATLGDLARRIDYAAFLKT